MPAIDPIGHDIIKNQQNYPDQRQSIDLIPLTEKVNTGQDIIVQYNRLIGRGNFQINHYPHGDIKQQGNNKIDPDQLVLDKDAQKLFINSEFHTNI